MIRRDPNETTGKRGGLTVFLLVLLSMLATASSANAVLCSDFGGVLDGNVVPNPPFSQVQIDQDCTIRNYPASNPLTVNFSFYSNPQGTPVSFLVVFDNVVHTGNMSCNNNNTQDHKIWFTNGSSSKIKQNCQDLLIPVEKIDKQNPAGTTTAAIGVPFTYTLTIPVLFDPATGSVINSSGSVNDLHSIVVTDNLNDTLVDLTYVSHVAYWESSGLPVSHSFSNVGGLLTFSDFNPPTNIVPAGEQIIIEITVVLEDNQPPNTPGTLFHNTAKWEFGRYIDGVFYEPLPGEWGISEDLMIAAPDLVVTKSGPATLGLTLNLGQTGSFTIDVHNTGFTDAYDVTLVDQLPDGPTGGMCDLTPTVTSAQIFEADGTTPVSPVLVQGTDFSFAYAPAPTCEMTLVMLTPQAVIGPDQRLIITYETKLDPDTQDGATLTNVVGATEWFNGDDTNPDRVGFQRTLTDGTPGTPDHEDAHTVTAALYGFFFEKSVENVTTGVSPAAAAAPGDVLRYTLRLQATDVALSDLTFYDDFAALNPSAVFAPGSLTLVSAPAGADTSGTNPNGGVNSEGILDVGNLSVPVDSEIEVVFELTLLGGLPDGTVVTNQAELLDLADSNIADSDDPNVNGQADPDIDGDEDPTVVVVSSQPVGPLLKSNTQATAAIGETFSYEITVPANPFPFPIYDVVITDDLSNSAADLEFLSVSKVQGMLPWSPTNTGTSTNLVIEDTTDGIDLLPNEQITVEITVRLLDTPTNAAPLPFTNTATYTYSRVDDGSRLPGDPDTTDPMTVVEPVLTMTKSGPATMRLGTPETFTLDVQNTGDGPAWNPTLTDLLPDGATGGTCDTAPTTVTAQVFESDGTTAASPVLVQGVDYSVSWSGAPGCLLTLSMLSAQATIDPGQRLIVTYMAQLDADSQNGATLTNIAGAVEWFSWDDTSPERRTYSEVVTDGTPGTLDHEDAHTLTVALPDYLFEKTVSNLNSGANPAATAEPGDVLRYTLRLDNQSDIPLDDLAFVDDLGSMNTPAVFEPGTLSLVTVPPGADVSLTDPNGGTNGTGLVDVRNLDLPTIGQIVIEFEVTLATPLDDGTLVSNQTQLLQNGVPYALSDDPNVNGPADPFVDGDEDPTVLAIQLPAAGPLVKANTQATAFPGETFTWEITVPETPFPFDIYDVQITDDLGLSAADLTYIGVSKVSPGGSWSPDNTGTGTNLVIEDTTDGIDIPADTQITIAITVRLDDSPTNVAPLAFTNTADWTYFTVEGDPNFQFTGGSDESPPMTVVEPDLTMTKSGPLSMAIGTPETFTLDVQNTGDSPAWMPTVTDLLPDGATGGTCDTPPANVTAQVFESDGTTPVSGVLSQGADYTVGWTGPSACLLTLAFTTDQSTIGVGQRLIVTYEAELDAGTQNGITLTNIAGAVEWFSDDVQPDRRTYSEVVTDGTPTVVDHEDSHTVGIALASYLFEKTVVNVDTGADPATTAEPGHTLRYTLRLENTTDIPLVDLAFVDDLGSLNSPAVFEAGTLNLVTVPPGADTSLTDPNGGTNGTGLIDIRNLDLPTAGQIVIEFEITLATPLVDGTLVTNQTQLLSGGSPYAVSDDPNVNGPANPFVDDDEDPTVVQIVLPPAGALQKDNTQTTASIGETFSYEITIPATPFPYDIYDVQITDDLAATGVDLRYAGVTLIDPPGAWTLTNSGTPTDLIIEDATDGIDIPANEQVTIEISVVVEDTVNNQAGDTFFNTAEWIYHTRDNDPTSQQIGDPDDSEIMTLVEPDFVFTKTGPATMVIGTPDTYTLDVENTGDGPAWNLTLLDLLPDTPGGGTCDTAPTNFTAQIFEADGTTPVSGVLSQGSDYTVTFDPAPDCELTLVFLTSQGIAPTERLIVTYDVELDSDTQDGVALTNIAGVIEWFSWDDTSPDRRTYTELLTTGTPDIDDHEDPHTVNSLLPDLLFEKTVANLVSGDDPATTANPGDVLRYRIYVENVGAAGLADFSIQDDLGSLNPSAVFEPGTLNVVSAPAGADASGTDPLGGSNGTGLLDVTGLSLPGNGDSLTIEFEITLASVLPDGTVVANQSQLLVDDTPFLPSDDPNVNGPADPDVADDEDPTELVIESAPSFVVEKTSAYITGDPTVLMAGETLRYTITVANVGTADAVGIEVRDQIPANTTYVPDSTTLNGTPVADVGGTSPLVSGMLIDAPADPNGGSVATIVFDVVVDPNATDGTIISNQAFVTSVPDGIIDDPSDDPRTPIIDDPTRDVVGALPLLFAAKDVVLLDDFGNMGIVDGGDSLLYTITIFNNGSAPATNAVLQDSVPVDTDYRAGTTTLNGDSVPDNAGPVAFPLDGGLPISSSDLTPPLPGPGAGILSPGETATITFVLEVDPLATPGTVISNQATVSSDDVPNLLTDGDGDPSTGPEPTVVVVGDGQQLTISKQVAVVGGGPVLAGSTLEYLVQVTNVSSVDVLDVLITDDLTGVTDLSYVAGSATMNGVTAGVSDAGSVIVADYGSTYGALGAGEIVILRFRATVNALVPIGTTITNTAEVTWNAGTQSETASVSIDVGGMPGVGVLSGSAWHDADFDDVQDSTERDLFGWSVDLYRNGALVDSTTTDANGDWSMGGLAPNDLTGDQYQIRFVAPGAGSGTAALGITSSPFTDGPQVIDDIVIMSGDNLQDLNLPIDPNGVVYDAILRAPVAGTALTLVNASTGNPVSSSCFEDGVQQGQITGPDGYYKFDLIFGDLSCPAGGSFLIEVAPPGAGYALGASQIIPPTTDSGTPPLLVPSCPGGVNDAVGATLDECESQISEFAPAPSIPPGPGTTYHLHLSFDDSNPPGSAQIFNNHIALDPVLNGAVGISKTTPSQNVSRGQLVPYEIVVTNDLGAPITDLGIVDTIPPGFRYVEGSARVDGVPMEPVQNGRQLTWDDVGIDALSSRTLVVLLAVGAGVSDGEYVNRAQAVSSSSAVALSGEASATVRVVPDPTFSCTDVMGKVFDDKNRNGAQDPGELGLQGVRVVTARGLAATTDQHGRYHFTCAALPNDYRGNNFILKLDDRSLPSGFRSSGRTTQVKRATAGKALRFNFGASIHRVVSLDMADPVFEPGTTTMRPQWTPRLGLLIDELKKGPSVLRLSYVADIEDADLVEERLEAVKAQIAQTWKSLEAATYPLTIEPEVYWRRGEPTPPPARRAREEQ